MIILSHLLMSIDYVFNCFIAYFDPKKYNYPKNQLFSGDVTVCRNSRFVLFNAHGNMKHLQIIYQVFRNWNNAYNIWCKCMLFLGKLQFYWICHRFSTKNSLKLVEIIFFSYFISTYQEQDNMINTVVRIVCLFICVGLILTVLNIGQNPQSYSKIKALETGIFILIDQLAAVIH